MTTAVTLFDQAPPPAELLDLNTEGNIVVRDSLPQLSFRGKVWRVVKDGKEDIVKNNEGDPVQSVNVVILDYNKLRSRSFYQGGYEEGKTAAPICWSKDGKMPDPTVPTATRQHANCDTCPQAQKGSKVTDAGKQVTACAQFKRLVIIPVAAPGHVPLLVKLPQTSMWDKDNKENEAKNFFAFDQYMEYLRGKGVNHTALVVTKMKFDARAPYPKLLFGAVGWTPGELSAPIKERLAEKELIEKYLNVADVSAPAEDVVSGVEAPAAPAAAPAPTPAPAAAPAAARAPKAPKNPPPPPKPTAPAADPDEPAGFGAAAAPAAAAIAKAAQPVAPAVTVSAEPAGEGLGALLKGWDD